MTLVITEKSSPDSWRSDAIIHFVVFLSVSLATCTLIVSGWILLSHPQEDADLPILMKCEKVILSRNGTSPPWLTSSSKLTSCLLFLEEFMFIWKANLFITSITAFTQLCLTGYLISGQFKDYFTKARLWIAVNVGANLIFLLCLASTWTVLIPKTLSSSDVHLLLSSVPHLLAFYIALFLNIVFGPVLLIMFFLLLRLETRSDLINDAIHFVS